MFGYIRPRESELRLREYRYYRGVYCGLCRAHGRCTGQCSRLTLSYDFVFLALLRLALEGGNPTPEGDGKVFFERRRCLLHPISRRLSLRAGQATDHTAICAALLNHRKLLDDRTDEKRFSRTWWRAVLAGAPVRAAYRRAVKRAPVLAEQFSRAMDAFDAIEADENAPASADAPAAAFGEAIALLLCHGLSGERATISHHLGYHVGKWLYFADALDDYDEDVRRDRFNPLRRLYGDGGLTEQHREAVAIAMGGELMRAEAALDLLDVDETRCGRELSALLTHMLREGLPQVTGELARGAHPHQKPRKRRGGASSPGDEAAEKGEHHDRSL